MIWAYFGENYMLMLDGFL
uniref:Uncharacterized protein n=1 Tax=Anguilla anguilla TaxID=7936 RepID=A0A0E9SRV1_ANGAN